MQQPVALRLAACLAVVLRGAAGAGPSWVGDVVTAPSPQQLAWQNLEVGAMITWNLQTFCVPKSSGFATSQECQAGLPSGQPLYLPTLEYIKTNMTLPLLNTTAWLEAASSFGARYAVLVADHMAGFALWPTRATNLSISLTPWKGGKGDVVADFFSSCAALGVRPGLFYSTHYNWNLGVNNYEVGWPRTYGGPPLTETEFEDIVLAQLEELAASYSSSLFELWYDGGVNTVVTPRVGPSVLELFPDSLCHSCINFTQHASGPNNGFGLRWMGDEEGLMPLPSWGAYSPSSPFNGDPTAPTYIPPSSDTVLSQHFWFWQESITQHLRSTCDLTNVYLTSVGRSSNLILNLAPNTTGALDEADVAAYAAMGDAIECLWDSPLGEVGGATLSPANNGSAVLLLPAPVPVPSSGRLNVSVHLQEDMSSTGQRIGQWSMDACVVASEEEAAGPTPSSSSFSCPEWTPLNFSGAPLAALTAIGHKRVLNTAIPGPAAGYLVAVRFTAVTAYRWKPDPSQPGVEAPIVLARAALFDWDGVDACVPAGCELVGW